MSIRKTGIALLCGSGFSLRTLKKKNDVFCPSLLFYAKKRHAKMRDVYAFLPTQKEMRQHDF